MFPNIKWLRLTPDRPGRGGTKTGIHSFQQEPVNDVRSLTGAHIYRGAWRREFASATYPAVQFSPGGNTQPMALHGYVYPSLTDPSAPPNVTVLSQYLHSAPAGSSVSDVGTGIVRRGPNLNTATPAVFQNIGGRCFCGDGVAEASIFDDRTPAIHSQANQKLGIGTPKQPMPNTAAGNVSAAGTGYLFGLPTGATVSPYLNHPNPDNMLGTIKATDTVTPSVIDSNWAAIYSGVIGALGAVTVDAVTSNTTPFTATGTISINPAVNPSLVTLAGATWPANYKYAGLSINFNGYSFVILTHGVLGATTGLDLQGNAIALSNVQLLILGEYDGPAISGVPYTITGCQVTFTNNNGISTVSTNSAAVPPGVAFGYSQMTASNLVQVLVFAVRANGYYRNLGNISLGPESDTEASGGSIQTITDAFMPATLKKLTSASNPWTIADEGAPISVEGAGPLGATLITKIKTYVSPGFVYLETTNQSGAAVGPVAAWWGNNPTISDAVMTNGSPALTSASNPFVSGDVGQPIVVEGALVTGAPLITTIIGYTGPGQVTLGANCTVVAGITGKHAWWKAISTTVHAGPTYAYAWYDPETGHCSNISPLYQLPRPASIGIYRDFANITPVFQIDSGSIAYPSGVDALRFSHILFFRTLSAEGSSTLYPIGSLNPYVGKVHPGAASTRGSWNPSPFRGWMGLPNNYISAPPLFAGPNVWYDFSSDSDLLLSGGFRAPQNTNEKPLVLLRGGVTQPGYPYAQAYWDRRLWVVNTQEPDKIAYSCDDAQCPLGVPVESFPPTNFLRLPSIDGRVIGMRTVGDMLLITTERWAYIIAGNNESNYRLLKVSSSMPGVGTYQMDEFPTYTGAEGEPTTLFYLGRDRIVYQWTIGGPVTPISQPIQDQLDTTLAASGGGAITALAGYQASRVHCVSAWGRRLVIVAPNPIGSPALTWPSDVHVYDIANQVWSKSFHTDGGGNAIKGIAPMTSVYGLDVPVNELFSIFDSGTSSIKVRSWLRDDTSGTSNLMDIITFPMNFDGKKTRKQIVSLNLHATGGQWAAGIYVNESVAAVTAAFAAYPDPLGSIYAPGAVPVDASATDTVVMAAAFSNLAPVVGYRFVIDIQKNADALPAKVYALDIGYVDYEEPGQGEP